MSNDDYIIVGKIVALHGIKGWVSIQSYTSPVENFLNYKLASPYKETYKEIIILNYNVMPKKIIIQIESIGSIEDATPLINRSLVTLKKELPATSLNEFYWHQLVDKKVINHEGLQLGLVESLFTSGENDILVIKNNKKDKKEILIPFMNDFIINVDLDNGVIKVKWYEEL